MTRLFPFLLVVMLFCACEKIRVENYYLPQHFEGNVAIIYKNDGSEPHDPQNWDIPRSGILRSAYKFLPGNYTTNYYRKNNSNSYDTLRYAGIKKDTTKIEIVFSQILTFSKEHSKDIFTVQTFYVGKRSIEETQKDRIFFERKLEEMLLGK